MIDVRLFPLLDPGKHFVQRAWLLPATSTAVVSLVLLAINVPALYLYGLAIYIAVALFFFVHLMCHQRKPFWAAAAIAMFTLVLARWHLSLYLLLLPFRSLPLFRDTVNANALGMGLRFLHYFVAAGLGEEFVKAVPLLLCWWVARILPCRIGRSFTIREPLDGIVLGAASGIGFSIAETMGQYVPNVIAQVQAQGGAGTALYIGITLLIPRMLGVLAGHMAYSGYLGYFIGLASMRALPVGRVLVVGWLSAALLHGLWDTFATVPLGIFAKMPVACLAWSCLAAAILEARRLVPRDAAGAMTRDVSMPASVGTAEIGLPRGGAPGVAERA